jgi:hypothetical protein
VFINFPISQYRITLWLVAFAITTGSAIFQRLTGPTYPVRGQTILNGSEIKYELPRSETTDKDAVVCLKIPDTTIYGYVQYKRFKSYDEWERISFARENDQLLAYLPKQPAAGKLMYTINLIKGDQEISLTEKDPIIIRFKGHVPALFLIPHIILMFLAMLYSNRTAVEALDATGQAKKYMYITIVLFSMGGLILGPIVQKFAFGSYWEGIPLGWDLTDNKTLIAMLGWIWAWIQNRKGKTNRGWIIFASILMLAIYLVPHSVLGSEIDYTKLNSSTHN